MWFDESRHDLKFCVLKFLCMEPHPRIGLMYLQLMSKEAVNWLDLVVIMILVGIDDGTEIILSNEI